MMLKINFDYFENSFTSHHYLFQSESQILIHIFFMAMNDHSKARINNYTNYGLIKMDPEEAWRVFDEITDFDATYAPQQPTRGLYVVPAEIDKRRVCPVS